MKKTPAIHKQVIAVLFCLTLCLSAGQWLRAGAKAQPAKTKIMPVRFLVLEARPMQNPSNPKLSMVQLRVAPHYGKIDMTGLKFRLENETHELKLMLAVVQSGEKIKRGDIISFGDFNHLSLNSGSRTVRHLPSGEKELVP